MSVWRTEVIERQPATQANAGWDDVRFFVALGNAGSLGRAADALGVSHVTVMRHVRALEAAVGTDLFVRRHDGHRLTTAGAELLRACREGGQLIDEALRRVAASSTETRPVRIATTELVANWLLLPRLAAARGLPPLAIDASPSERDLLDHAATIAVRFRRPMKGAFSIRRLGTIDFGLYAAAQADEAAGMSYIGWTGDFGEIGLSRWLRASFADVEPALALTTIEGHRSAAASGVGVAALPLFVGDRDARLIRIRANAAPFALTAWLTVPLSLSTHRDVRVTVKFIIAAFHDAGLG